jgi:hypothetical protein
MALCSVIRFTAAAFATARTTQNQMVLMTYFSSLVVFSAALLSQGYDGA